jgi:hypothetical protein
LRFIKFFFSTYNNWNLLFLVKPKLVLSYFVSSFVYPTFCFLTQQYVEAFYALKIVTAVFSRGLEVFLEALFRYIYKDFEYY